MKIAGIIAEYNPFHNGHAYLIRTLREAGYDCILTLMSGDFVQRGEPAVIGKYGRTRMALLGGSDLVLELPSLFSLSSAEFFAEYGVRLFDALGCVDTLAFGCETPEPEVLSKTAELLNLEPESYRQKMKELLKEGLSYPRARAEALSSICPESKDLLSSPNNILAVEYYRAAKRIRSSMTLFPVLRRDEGYHSALSKDDFCSAEGIRLRLLSGEKPLSYLPAESAHILFEEPLLTAEDFFPFLKYRLLSEEAFTGYSDCSEALSNKLIKYRDKALSLPALHQALKTRDLTLTRISRVLFHILLGHTSEDLAFYRSAPLSHAGYARVLGFQKASEKVLGLLKEHASLPLLTACKEAEGTLSPHAFRLFSMDIYASRVYNLVCSEKTGRIIPDDFHRPMEIL